MAVSLKDLQTNNKVTTPRQGAGEKPATAWQRLLRYELGGGRLKDSFKESFYAELALLLEAGMNIKSSLELLAEQQKKDKVRQLIGEMEEQLTRGARFSEVLQALGKFTPYEYYSIRIGEETGQLIDILKSLSRYYEQRIQQRRTLTGALSYPFIIMLTAFLAVTFMLTYMVPMFQEVFQRMGEDLPALTQFVIGLSEGFGSFIQWAGLFLGLAFLMHLKFRKHPYWRKIRAQLWLRIPFLGKLVRKTHLLRLIQSLSLLITSRVPLNEALEHSRRMVRFYPIEHSLDGLRDKIMKGESLYQGMGAYSIYDSRLVALVKVGEETNQLGLIFGKLARQMEEELQHQAKVLGNALEPLIIVFLGFLVALILIAMYLPMFQVSGAF